MSIKDLMGVKASDLVMAFKLATEYSATIFYTGTKPSDEIKTTIEQTIKFIANPKPGKGYQEREINVISENTVYLINESVMQSQINILANGQPFDIKDRAKITAYNNYLAGGFTGLLVQEIRESRSLAYTTGGSYSIPGLIGKPGLFYGTIGTQNDKTNVAIDVFMDIINNFPQKPERMNVLRTKLELSAVTTRPDFRNLAQTVESWQRLGYTEDPLKMLLPAYKVLQLEDIVKFNDDFIKPQPKALMIVGLKKQIDTKSLSQYGKIKELKLNDIFSKDE
jgi:predicted Zn-dependent peptidase